MRAEVHHSFCLKDAEKSIIENGDPCSFTSQLEKLPDNVVVIGSHTLTGNRKEKVIISFGESVM